MKVSVIMANYRGAGHLVAAIRSVLRQSHADLELIVSDDASPDDSLAVVRREMAGDRRLRLIEAPANSGPAAARNRALDAATGDWVAIVDSDDLMHPQRLERLLAAAQRLDADIIADDLIFFGDTVEASGRTLLQDLDLTAPLAVSTSLYLQAGGGRRKAPALGYLKPMIRRSLIGAVRYDESLRIGEDYDLILRLLIAGARFRVLPDPMYLYRRHSASISHRLSVGAVTAMLAAHDRIAGDVEPALMAERRRLLLSFLRHECLVQALRTRRYGRAIGLVLRHPGLVGAMGRSLSERLARKAAAPVVRSLASLRLGVGLPVSKVEPLSIPCPPVPEPGDPWPEPPAQLAVALSLLQVLYHLSPVAEDAAGAWAAGLVPLGGPPP